MPDRSGKTEQPTQRRLQKARKDGQFPAAKEFVGALQFLVFLGLLSAGGAAWFAGLQQTARSVLYDHVARSPPFGGRKGTPTGWRGCCPTVDGVEFPSLAKEGLGVV